MNWEGNAAGRACRGSGNQKLHSQSASAVHISSCTSSVYFVSKRGEGRFVLRFPECKVHRTHTGRKFVRHKRQRDSSLMAEGQTCKATNRKRGDRHVKCLSKNRTVRNSRTFWKECRNLEEKRDVWKERRMNSFSPFFPAHLHLMERTDETTNSFNASLFNRICLLIPGPLLLHCSSKDLQYSRTEEKICTHCKSDGGLKIRGMNGEEEETITSEGDRKEKANKCAIGIFYMWNRQPCERQWDSVKREAAAVYPWCSCCNLRMKSREITLCDSYPRIRFVRTEQKKRRRERKTVSDVRA